ncbi:MAG: DPP IV N-terminal domain-containing protein, partial [Actinomycetota bacterium]|nr:DPP IV N-terminal domain-containing protein [Actinomycetota bacterium]
MRTLRMTLVLLLATSILVVIPGEVDATPPGEIGRIAFISTRDEIAGEIYVRDFAGSQAIRLTTNTAEDVLPRWSPDGDRLAFSQLLGDWDVHVINDDGSNEINLTNDVFYDDLLMDWSPDGSRLLFASDRGGTMDLWTMHPDGTSAQRLTDNSDEEFDADFSPDGSTIAFCTRAGGSFDYYIWLIDADGSNPRRLDATKEGCDPA